MSKRDALIAKYAADLSEKCGVTPDADLLKKVVIGCGPAIYSDDAETVASSDPEELERIRRNFLIKKLGLADDAKLAEGMDAVIERYGRSNRNKYRAVVYYLLVDHFGKASVFA